jgi:predicted nuclease of predicted toxin-antitoxin system
VTGQPIRVLLDEDVFKDLAEALRRRGWDAVHVAEVGSLGLSDEAHLERCAREGRVMFTFNVSDFPELHARWLREGKHHAGILLCPQRAFREVLRRLPAKLGGLQHQDFADRLEWI